MMMYRRLFKPTTILSRSISLTSTKFVDVPSSKPLSEERQAEMSESMKKMQWRLKPYERKDEWYSKFKLFLHNDDDPVKETFITKLQKPINLSPSYLMKMWKQNLEKKERYMQQFVPERHSILGNDLAAAHFLVFRNARVKFEGEKEWIKMNEDGSYRLPDKYVHGMFLEAIDCEGVVIYYEGLENMRRLRSLRFISFKGIKSFDDWCLDRVSGSELDSLEELNLAGTSVSERGLQALYRIPSLKKLVIDDPNRNTNWMLVTAMLQEIMPELEIVEAHDKAAKSLKA